MSFTANVIYIAGCGSLGENRYFTVYGHSNANASISKGGMTVSMLILYSMNILAKSFLSFQPSSSHHGHSAQALFIFQTTNVLVVKQK